MAKIIVFLEGTKITEVELDAKREYLFGRASTCDVVLAHPKISRQHLKLSFDGKNWSCAVLSKYGNVLLNGHPMTESFSLANGSQFSVPPYEVKFEGESAAQARVVTDPAAPIDLSGKTNTGIVNLRGVLFRVDGQQNAGEEINLGPNPLTAGRSKTCGLVLAAAEASRRHFSIEMQGQDFILSDLGSANKTYVNGHEVHLHTLQSGDEIMVGNEKFRFELINPELAHVSSAAVPDVPGPQEAAPHTMSYPVPVAANGAQQPAVVKIAPGAQVIPISRGRFSLGGGGRNKNIQAVALALLAVVIVYEVAAPKKDSGGKLTSGSTEGAGKGENTTSFDRLTPEQKKSIEETYNLAMTLYTTGKYDLAAIEINKIFQLVNNYKDARNIQALCQQALEIKKQQDDVARIKNEQEALKQKVNDILDGCENLLKSKKYSEVEGCVSQVADLDPENERAQNLLLAAKQTQEQIQESQEQRAERERQKKYAYEMFGRAQKDYQAKRYLASVKEYETVERVAFADPDGIKEKAKVGVKSAREELQKQSDDLVKEGKQALDNKDFGTAYEKFSSALKIYPANGDAQEYSIRAARELHFQVKNMYEESVIEENLGNIESAKKKWHTILKQDVKADDYYQKAGDKLRKYEK